MKYALRWLIKIVRKTILMLSVLYMLSDYTVLQMILEVKLGGFMRLIMSLDLVKPR